MTSRLSCHHGHELDILELPESTGRVTCPRCGSITKVRPAHETKQSGSVDATIDSAENSGGVRQSNYEAAEADSKAARFLTLDHSSDSANQSSSEHDSREMFEPPTLAGYQVLDELGRGGMGVVYRARNEAMGREVALKTLQRMSPDGLHRFKQEFRTLADIAHPNLASLYELLSDGQTWCFTMEILEGVDFLEYVWSGFDGPDSKADCPPITDSVSTARLSAERQARLVNALSQLAMGLNVLHDAGVLHSDIKPSNVLMTKEGRLVLLDFGLAAQIRKHATNEKRIVQGTPLYMSPEQAAGGLLSRASDWYAVGVMLYEVLTGRFPFSGGTMRILSRKRSETPQMPDHFASATLQYLNDLCIALLARDPERRPTATEVLRCVGADALADQLEAHQPATDIRSVELVGRERHFDVLRDALTRVSEGDTLSFFVHGKSGMGKSVLVRSFLDGVQQQRAAVVLEGRCYEQESVPFKALDSLIDSLSVYLEALPAGEVQVVMPRDRLALTRVFPVLDRAPEAPNASYPSIDNVDQQELRQRAMNALRELLQRLAIREPLILYIDDLQWGDVDSAGLLADLVRPPDAPRLLLLGSYRSEDVESSLCLQALSEAYSKGQYLPHREELAVQSLTQTESTQLALTLLGREDDASRTFANKIAEESGGWPFFVWELAQHVQQDPQIADQSLELDEVIWTRVNRLPEEARRLLELIAVSGRPIPVMEAYQAIGAVERGQAFLAQLRIGNFVRTTGSEDSDVVVESYHDRVRESVVDHLDQGTLRQHNLQLALMIEQVSGIEVADLRAHINSTADWEESTEPYQLEKREWQRVFDLASFFDAAGEHERAFPFALAAAEQARKQNALEVAEQQYCIARNGASKQSDAIRFRVLEGLGSVLVLRGQYKEAHTQLEAALSLAPSAIPLARIEGKLGAMAFKQGDLRTAGEYLERALIALGERPPGNFPSIVVRLCKEAVVQVLHTFSPSLVGIRSADSAAGRMDLLRARVLDAFTMICWYTRGVELCLWCHLREMNIAERYQPSAELAKVYSFHSIVMSGLPMARRGMKYAQRSHDISKDRGDLWSQGQALSFYTFNYFVTGQHEKAIETSGRGVELLEQAGDVWEANMARMMNTWSLYHAGDLKAAYRQTKRVLAIGKEVRDYSAVAISLCFWMQIDPKSAPEGEMQEEVDRPRDDATSGALAIQGRGLEILFREDDPLRAAKVLQESLDLCKNKGVRNVCVFASATWKVTALRIAAERESEGPSRRQAIKRAREAARSALKITKQYLTCRAHLLRECGLLEVLAVREEQARQYFDESIELAEAQGARREHAKSMLARGEAGLIFGWPDAAQQVAEARPRVEQMENLTED
ncbi:MAG: protein kinase [Planctomycetes bacterium]|nr:protein kinase [Planctomycetota bacterium]